MNVPDRKGTNMRTREVSKNCDHPDCGGKKVATGRLEEESGVVEEIRLDDSVTAAFALANGMGIYAWTRTATVKHHAQNPITHTIE